MSTYRKEMLLNGKKLTFIQLKVNIIVVISLSHKHKYLLKLV